MLRSKLRLVSTGGLVTAFLLNLGVSASFCAGAQMGVQNGHCAITRQDPATASTVRMPLTKQYTGQGSPVIRSGQARPGAFSATLGAQPYGIVRQLPRVPRTLAGGEHPQRFPTPVDRGRFLTDSPNRQPQDWRLGDGASLEERDPGGPERTDRVRLGRGERRHETPQTGSRSPEGARKGRAVAPPRQAGGLDPSREQLRRPIRTRPSAPRERTHQDAVGNPIPADASWLNPGRVSHISKGFQNIAQTLGSPSFRYVFVPRSQSDYWEGYWDGFGDGYRAGYHHRRHRTTVSTFFYSHYFSDPAWLGFYYPGYYASIYHYWGWCPGWVHPSRVYDDPVDYIHIPAGLSACDSSADCGVDYIGAERAILDIRGAWCSSGIGLLARHLNGQLDIHVHFDGEYVYTTYLEDYYAMTADMMATTQTVEMVFDVPVWLSSHEVVYTGRQAFYDPYGDLHTVYVSYRLRQLSSGWEIVAVGSSLDPIEAGYTDFRYE